MSGADAPTRGVVFRRLFVRGRSVAIGSANTGNVTDVLFDDCTIGDDEGSSPWAFKIKMHTNSPGLVGDIMVRDTKFGKISANTWQDSKNYPAILMSTSYDGHAVNPRLPQPRISNISFVNVSATATVVAGEIIGALHNITELHFEACNFRSSAQRPWLLTNVSLSTCSAVDTMPPFPHAKAAAAKAAAAKDDMQRAAQ
jgi:hypothetical protein